MASPTNTAGPEGPPVRQPGAQGALWAALHWIWARWARLPVGVRRAAPWVGLGALIVFTALSLRDGGDFDTYLHAGARLRAGEDPYTPPHYKTMPYTYGLIWTLLMAAVSPLPGWVVNGVFSLLSLYLVYRCWQLVVRALASGAGSLTVMVPPAWPAGLALILGVLMARYLNYQIHLIQMTPLMLWGCLEAARLEGSIPSKEQASRRGPLWAGLIVGGLAAAKVLPLVMLAFWALTTRWRAMIWGVVGLALALILPALVLGWARYSLLMANWWASIDPTAAHRALETDITQHGLPSVVPGLLMPLETELPYRRHLIDLGHDGARAGLRLAQVALALLASYPALRLGWAQWTQWAGRSGDPLNAPVWLRGAALPTLWALALMLAAVPLLLPQQQKYAFLMIAPLLAAHGHQVLYGVRGKAVRLSAAALLVWLLGAVLTDTAFLGTDLSRITQHYKLISWATIGVIALGVLACPRVEPPPTADSVV